MAYNLADLHVHSFCSDGLRTPTQAVEEARSAGVRALSITDHDTVDGIDEATRAQSRLSQLLRQVPPIAQTHPPDALQNLASASAETIPGVLAAGDDRGFKSFANTRRDLGGRIVNSAHPEKDFAALIREAEQAAEANS